MRQSRDSRIYFLSCLMAFLLVCAGQPAAGQAVKTGLQKPHIGLGYVGNAPEAMVGGGGYVLLPYLGGIGLYLDAKFDVERPSGKFNFETDLTAQNIRDQFSGADFIERESSSKSFNIGLVRPFTPFLLGYAGIGINKVTQYHFFQAPGSGLGYSGVFWVEAPAEKETNTNFMIGAFLRMSSFLSTQVGFETEPGGFTFGASLRYPRG